MPVRRVAVVSGSPGAGKSTVASLLAARLDLPLLSLDVIKETLAESLGLGDQGWSMRLGDAAEEIVFTLARSFPNAVVGSVVAAGAPPKSPAGV